jgi:endonuclease/exonuclease/phosphatase family metal-dependent hydrolase
MMKRISLSVFVFAIITLALGSFSFAQSLRVMTYNTWLLPEVLELSSTMKDKDLRVSNMPEHLASTGSDIIALQEVWTSCSASSLIDEMTGLGYSFHAQLQKQTWSDLFRGRGCFIGNGLLVFSKYPISERMDQLTFPVYTRLDEYLTLKGAIHLEVLVPELGWIDFYNTHLGAISYDDRLNDFNFSELTAHRLQMNYLTQFIRDTRRHPIQIIAGDFNQDSHPWEPTLLAHNLDKDTENYSHFIGSLALIDTFREMNGHKNEQYTYDKIRNPYVRNGKFSKAPSETEDYIFITRDQSRLRINQSQLELDYPIHRKDGASAALGSSPESSFFLSDHFAVKTAFEY